MIYNSFLQFQTNITNVRTLSTIYSSLKSLASGHDISDILRAQWFMAVSCLDYFVHNAVEEGILEIYQNKRTITEAFKKFEIPMENMQQISTNPTDILWLKAIIHDKHGWQSFQKSDKIPPVIKLISEKHLWDEIGKELNKSSKDIRDQLDLIVDRRNVIGHEADADRINLGQKNNITQNDVEEVINFIENLVNAMYEVIK